MASTMFSALRSRFFPASVFAAAAATAATTQTSWGMPAQADAKPEGALNPSEFKPFKLIQKKQLTHNTYLFRFELPPHQTAGMTVASCLVTKAILKEKPFDEKPKAVVRAYTPTSGPDTKGHMDLVVKVYPQGVMSKHFGNLKVGDTLEMKGPIPKIEYQPNKWKKIGMVAGGTGITPMLQVIDAIAANKDDKTEVVLLYASQTEKDVILKDKLDALAVTHPNIKVHYYIDADQWAAKPVRNTSLNTGRINKGVIESKVGTAADGTIVFVCGPPPMMESISGGKAPDWTQGEVKGALKELGYTPDKVFKF